MDGLFPAALRQPVSPPTSPLASPLGSLVNVNSNVSMCLWHHRLTSSLPPPTRRLSFSKFISDSLGFCSRLCLSLSLSPALVRVSFPTSVRPPCPLSALLSPHLRPLTPCVWPRLGSWRAAPSGILAQPLTWPACLSSTLLISTDPARQVSPPSLPGGGSTVTPAASPNPATLFPPSVGMMKSVASASAPQVGLGSNGPPPGGSPPPSPPSCPPCGPGPPSVLPASAVPLPPTEQSEVIQRKGCLPRAQCPLPGQATYWSHAYALRHHCCDRDLCNAATTLQRPPGPGPLVLTLLLTASFTCGGHLLH